MIVLGYICALATVCGLVAVVAGAVAVRRFAARTWRKPLVQSPVTVLKPLYGNEALLEDALASLCRQDYPALQIVFGVQSPDDLALAAVARIRERYPAADISVVVEPILHGNNRKISNLINMLPMARHDVLVFSDSDLHVGRDYVASIVGALERPGVGLVTTLCGGLPTAGGIAGRLGATGISHSFLPSALLSRALGRQDGLGATMALRRSTLAQVGGLQSLVMHLADDNVLAKRVRTLGLDIALADTVPLMAVPERSLTALWQHELRWARTIRALAPRLFATSVVQYPLFWAAAALASSLGATWAIWLFCAAWAIRAAAACSTDRIQANASLRAVPVWLLPARDIMSVMQIIASYLGSTVVWRGHVMQADNGHQVPSATVANPAASAAG